MTGDNMKLDDVYEVPVVDLAGLHGPERKSICAKLVRACEEWGFFQITNHGIDLSLMRKVEKVNREFFYLPAAEKKKFVMKERFEGWSSPIVSNEPQMQNYGMITPETCEFYYHIIQSGEADFELRVPTNPPALRPIMLEYTKEVKAAQERVLAALSEALGLEPDCLRKRLGTPTMGCRSNIYPVRRPPYTGGIIEPHSDQTALTFLLSDLQPGLEIRKDGRWLQIAPIPGAYIVNVGDCLEVMSNGRFRSIEHRGLGNQAHERLSLAMFYIPARSTLLGPVEELLDESHPPRYQSVTFAEYIDAFITKGLKGKRYVEELKIKA